MTCLPIGKYYLADAGYTNGPGFLAPFRSPRYHLKEWASSQQHPQTAKELYNLRHSRARNVVERTFGLWKKKWGILRTQSFFDIKDQVTCVHWVFNKMHNILKNSYVKSELVAALNNDPNGDNIIRSVQVTTAWTNFRNQLSNDMFAEYVVAHANLQQ